MAREGETDSEREFYKPYRAALNDDWEPLKKFCEKNVGWLSYAQTASRDNAFHLAVFSQKKELLQSLLNISKVSNPMIRYGYLEQNDHGNTPLHEAAANGNLEAVKTLINHHRNLVLEDLGIEDENKLPEAEKELLKAENELLEVENMNGETPLFIAAAFGSTEVVKFLAPKSLENSTIQIYEEGERKKLERSRLKNEHRQHMGLINVEPKSDASNRLSRVIRGEIILEPKPDASNRLSGAIQGEIMLEPKPNASNQPANQLSGAIWGEIMLEPKPDSSNQLSGAIRADIMLEPKPDASNQLSGAIRGKIILEPKPGQKEGHDASILHVAIRGHHFETALYLLNLDESLATVKDLKGWTSLHLLATMPSAFKSGYQWGTWIHRVLYFCLPVGDNQNATSCLTACSSSSDKPTSSKISKGWLILAGKICELVSNILEEKRKHKLALYLTERLIKEDSSWDETILWQVAPSSFNEDQSSEEDYEPIPLLLATERGIVGIVNQILDECPQLAEHINDMGQNILHLAIKHRQYDIFTSVINMRIPLRRLVGKFDKNGYTILHHAADMEPETTEIHPAGPVYQLQEEIKWYNRVQDITPTHYAMLRDKKEHKTCEELFNMKHNELLGKAREWTKDTSQSCSAVAVLVATVVFAAAYTVPGGSNEKGYPIFLNSRLFLLFTVMDVIALASSLTSVVMFLSVLTSPYTYREFHHKLPRKLTIGFSLLFLSLTTTMIAFAATLLLIIRLEKPRWTTTFIYTAAFFPVSIFALTNFPMHAAFKITLLKLYHILSKRWCVTKPPPTKKSASGQGSIADQAAPKQTESQTQQNRKDGQLSKRNVNDNKPRLPV